MSGENENWSERVTSIEHLAERKMGSIVLVNIETALPCRSKKAQYDSSGYQAQMTHDSAMGID
jgi:hypothetical protein